MKWHAKPETLKSRYFEIREDPSVGFYLYIFENNKCIRDHLQDTLEIAMNCAWDDYGVPKTSWKKIMD